MHAQRWGLVVTETADYFGEVRAAAEPRWDFAFDAHAQLFEPYRAIELGNALAPYQPMFFEEPIRPEHIPSWRHLREQLRVPLATGESLYSPHEFLALLTAGGVD
nr:enolase C-terminal domain-like protein [Microbacterium sorbitolivorans]